jgi:hypothetical protein
VAILTAIAVPGFKKATEDYRLNSTAEDTLSILKACRNYYLIFNEFPPNMSNGIPDRLLPFVPRHLIDPNKGTDSQGRANVAHRWAPRALGNYEYHVNNFMQENYKPHGTGVSLYGVGYGTANWNKLYNRFKSIIGERYISPFDWKDRMFCMLPESPGSTDPDSNTLWENRYY